MNDSVWNKRIHEPFLLAAFGIALTFGFGYAVVLVEARGHQVQLGAWWMPLVQTHGHAQLFGWLGLFVMGMALYFLPRLAGVKLRAADRARVGFWILVLGIFLRGISQPTLGYVEANSTIAMMARAAWLVSALLELAGAGVIATILSETRRALPPLSRDAPGYPVLPLVAIAVASFALAFLLNAFATIGAVFQLQTVLSGAFDSLIITLVLYGIAIPMAFLFSVRNLPLFLRLAMPPREELRVLAVVYALGLLARIAPPALAILQIDLAFVTPLDALGLIAPSAVILIFVWQIDLLRRKPPWIVNRAPNTRPDLDHLRKPTRPNYPDAGEYGRFELLIYSAYAWLVFVALVEIARGASLLIGFDFGIAPDAERHALTIGFVSLLIFGMAARMAPGFSGKARLAHPRLVAATFFLGNLAVLFRVLPLLFPNSDSLLFVAPSGALGWVAVLLLALNIARTIRLN